MRRLLTTGALALAIPLTVGLFAAPAALANPDRDDTPRPTPVSYQVARTYSFDGDSPARRIAVSCDRGDQLTDRRAVVTPLSGRDRDRDRRRAVVRLTDEQVDRARARFSARVEPTGREDGRARVTLQIRCRDTDRDRDRRGTGRDRRDDRRFDVDQRGGFGGFDGRGGDDI